MRVLLIALASVLSTLGAARAADLIITNNGSSTAQIVVANDAGEWEKRAAADVARCLELMSGAKMPVVDALGGGTQIVVGKRALETDPSLAAALAKVAKKEPVLRGDAIVIRRVGDRVLAAGANDECHYYAAMELLRRWGCRWYLPTEFGECIPEQKTVTLGELDYAYAPPFEVRRYWISWNGDSAGKPEFMRRNFYNDESVPNGHALAKYVSELIPTGKTMFNVPVAEDKTIDHVVAKLQEPFSKGENIMLGMEDGIYESDSPKDKELIAGLRDKYFLSSVLTDPFMVFYNGVAKKLSQQHPQSKSRIGFLAYGNLTLPPQRKITAEKPLVAYLAPIDIDPIHGMDDPRSPPRQEYKQMLYRWAEVMQGRLVIYDYDQSMMVWRDIPNPSHIAFQNDVQHYRKAGILGVDAESRNAIATTFLNLYLRGQLCWNPDLNVQQELDQFYVDFYGPAAAPMKSYWGLIYKQWQDTLVTEHEYPLIPAVYPRSVVEQLRPLVAEAEQALSALATKSNLSRNEKLYLDRLKFTKLSFEIIDQYTAMAVAAATEGNYAAAVAAGDKALAAREQLTAMNGTFTTYKAIGEQGAAWFPGEVQQYRDLAKKIDGTDGQLIARLPLEWAFRRDPHDTGLASRWAETTPDLTWWNAQPEKGSIASHQHNPGHWEMMRADLYLQAQGLISPDYHSYTGLGWYHTTVDLKPEQIQPKLHLLFPGVFNECWLYVNGNLVAHREQREPWWYNDYKFEWDVDIAQAAQAGGNTIVLRIKNPHHFGGMFRRPLLYRPAK
jgi:hypothetical protein